MQQRVTPKSLIAENEEDIMVGYETTSKLFFPINPLEYSYKRHKQP